MAVKKHAFKLFNELGHIEIYVYNQATENETKKDHKIGHTTTINFCGFCWNPTPLDDLTICSKRPGKCRAICCTCLEKEDAPMEKCMSCQKWTCWDCGIFPCSEPACAFKSLCSACAYEKECQCFDAQGVFDERWTCVEHKMIHTARCREINDYARGEGPSPLPSEEDK